MRFNRKIHTLDKKNRRQAVVILVVSLWGVALPGLWGSPESSYSENYNWARRPVDSVYDPGLRRYSPARPAQSNKSDVVLQAGPLEMRADAGSRFTYDDNIALSENNRRDDLIITPYTNIGILWPLTDINQLNLTIGLYRNQYLFNPEETTDGIGIAPNSALEFWVYVGDYLRIVFFDHFALEEDAIDEPTLNNTLGFSRFTNTAGATAYWAINDNLNASLGYRYTKVISLSDEFDFLDRDTHSVDASISYDFGPDSTVGLFANTGWTQFSEDLNNDSLTHTVGTFVDSRITDYIRGNVSVSYAFGSFDSGGTNGDSDDLSGLQGVSFNGIFTHRVNKVMTHSIGGGRASRLGTTSNFFTSYYVRHTADFKVVRDVSLATNAFVEFVDESGSDTSEEFTRWGAGIQMLYRWNEHLTTGLRYQFSEKLSDVVDRDYYNNRFTLDVNYRF